jgi:hypothetical protein
MRHLASGLSLLRAWRGRIDCIRVASVQDQDPAGSEGDGHDQIGDAVLVEIAHRQRPPGAAFDGSTSRILVAGEMGRYHLEAGAELFNPMDWTYRQSQQNRADDQMELEI